MQIAPTSPTSPRLQFVHGLVRKEARCLLQYVGESVPWASPERQETLTAVLRMARHEAHQLEQIVRYCVKTRYGLPSLGAYPQSYMSINFQSIEFLLPLIVEDQKRRIADLDWSLLSAPEDFQGMLRDLIAAKKKHLEKMQGLTGNAETQRA